MALIKRAGRRIFKDSPTVQRFPTDQYEWSTLVREIDGQHVGGSFTPTVDGFSVAPTSLSAVWQRNWGFITISFSASALGTSNATNLTIENLPEILRPTSNIWVPWAGYATDNGVAGTYSAGAAHVQTDGNIDFYPSTGAWTAANTKGWLTANKCTFTYPLFPPT